MSTQWIISRFSNPADRTTITSKYIQIKKFSTEDSNTILESLNNIDSSVYFQDITGNIRIDYNTQFVNPLLNKPWDSIGILNDYKVSLTPGSNYIFSKPHGLWALYYTSDIFYLLYNPIPRPEWSMYYKNSNHTDSIYRSTMDMCKETKMTDPVCGCINRVAPETDAQGNPIPDTEFCTTQLLGGGDTQWRKAIKEATGEPTWSSMSNVCHCQNANCSQYHPFEKTYRESNICNLNIQIANCVAGIKAGGAVVSDGPISFRQTCTNDSGTTPNKPNTPAPSNNTPAPSTNTPDPSTNTPKKTEDTSNTQSSNSPSDDLTNSSLNSSSNSTDELSPTEKYIYIFGSVAVMVIVIYSLYKFLFSSDTPKIEVSSSPSSDPSSTPSSAPTLEKGVSTVTVPPPIISDSPVKAAFKASFRTRP